MNNPAPPIGVASASVAASEAPSSPNLEAVASLTSPACLASAICPLTSKLASRLHNARRRFLHPPRCRGVKSCPLGWRLHLSSTPLLTLLSELSGLRANQVSNPVVTFMQGMYWVRSPEGVSVLTVPRDAHSRHQNRKTSIP